MPRAKTSAKTTATEPLIPTVDAQLETSSVAFDDVDNEDSEGNAAKVTLPAQTSGEATVLCDKDLRVIVPKTGNAVLFEAGVPRKLNKAIGFAAQSAGALCETVVTIT